MPEITVPRIMIAGTARGVGKSLLAIGLAHELRRRGVGFSWCVVGGSLAQAIVHRRISGRYVRCLDDRLLSANQNLFSLGQASLGAELVCIEGHDGLYDGTVPASLRGSDAELAALLGAPVVLVADSRGFANSIAALLKGYTDTAQGFLIAGSVFNRAEPSALPQLQRSYDESLEWLKLRPTLGVIPELTLGASPPPAELTEARNTTALPRQFFVDLAAAVGAHVDVESIIQSAALAPALPLPGNDAVSSPRRTRIAVSDDGCFTYCIQDNLELLRFFGAELVPFSPLADTSLPERIGGVYLTGGFLPEYARELAANTGLKNALREFAQGGGVIYAEGGGAALLAREIRIAHPEGGSESVEGAGILRAVIAHTESRARVSAGNYFEGVTIEESILGRAGMIVKGIASGEWKVQREEPCMKILRLSRAGSPSLHEGYSPTAQVVATLSFAHFGSNPEIARNLVDAAEVVLKI